MAGNRKINGPEFLKDIRSHMSMSELMRKYLLSEKEIDLVLKKLEKRIPHPARLYGRSWSKKDRDGDDATRSVVRHEVCLTLPVHDMMHPKIQGCILDLSDKGLRIHGIESRLNQVRAMLIRPEKTFGIPSIVFRARCRWVSRAENLIDFTAGYEIIEIAPRDLANLRKLTQAIDRTNRQEAGSQACLHSKQSETGGVSQEKTWKCPACGLPQFKPFDECPQCGVIVAKFRVHQRAAGSNISAHGEPTLLAS